MILDDLMDSKEQSINHPPLYKDEKFELWKLKMVDFLKYCNVDLLEVIEIEVSSLLDTSGNLCKEYLD